MLHLLIAIGMIQSAEQATKFIEAGADRLISPFFNSIVLAIAQTHYIMWMSCCITSTEIHTAKSAGYDLVKIFPGNQLNISSSLSI